MGRNINENIKNYIIANISVLANFLSGNLEHALQKHWLISLSLCVKLYK